MVFHANMNSDRYRKDHVHVYKWMKEMILNGDIISVIQNLKSAFNTHHPKHQLISSDYIKSCK